MIRGATSSVRGDYALVDQTGDVVLTVRHLWPPEPVECGMCGTPAEHTHCVPWYCGPVASGTENAGYRIVCKPCHDRWVRWDDSLRYYGA